MLLIWIRNPIFHSFKFCYSCDNVLFGGYQPDYRNFKNSQSRIDSGRYWCPDSSLYSLYSSLEVFCPHGKYQCRISPIIADDNGWSGR